MLMRALGRSKWTALGGWVLAIFLGLSCPGAGYPKEAPVTQTTPPPGSGEAEIIFTGKLFCSLKRRIDLPFKGVITSLRAHSGQRVETGEILATYHLAPETQMAIHQRLSPPQISDLEMRLSEMDHSRTQLVKKQKEISRLASQKLAPAESLTQIDEDLQWHDKVQTATRQRLQEARKLARQDQEVLSDLLGTALKSGQAPQEGSLKAPISGYIIGVNPEMRDGAELTPMPGAFQVGVMDPMLLRAQVFEIEALQIKIGEQADVTLDALPGRKFQAKVSRIAWASIATGPEQPAYYEVELKVPNPDLILKEGLKARIVLRKSE